MTSSIRHQVDPIVTLQTYYSTTHGEIVVVDSVDHDVSWKSNLSGSEQANSLGKNIGFDRCFSWRKHFWINTIFTIVSITIYSAAADDGSWACFISILLQTICNKWTLKMWKYKIRYVESLIYIACMFHWYTEFFCDTERPIKNLAGPCN